MITFSPFIILLFYYPCRIMCHQGFHFVSIYVFLKSHNEILRMGGSKNISSYDLFVVQRGIECAMFPHLYPTGDFTDTGILAHYQATYGDNTSRVASIGLSWTRKCTSGIRAYAEHRDLSFFFVWKTSRREVFFCSGAVYSWCFFISVFVHILISKDIVLFVLLFLHYSWGDAASASTDATSHTHDVYF